MLRTLHDLRILSVHIVTGRYIMGEYHDKTPHQDPIYAEEHNKEPNHL